MKYSKTTFDVLLTISLGLIEVAIEIMETGYLMGKRPEYKWTYQRFQEFDKTALTKKLDSLSRQGIIEKIEDRYYLTKRGQAKFSELDLHFSLNLPINKPWSGIWYLIAFDIPIIYNQDRERLRRILANAGFIKIQQSLYVYPHNINQEFYKIQSIFPERQLMVVESSSNVITQLVYSRFKKRNIIT